MLNLLPWREDQTSREIKQFLLLNLVLALITASTLVCWRFYLHNCCKNLLHSRNEVMQAIMELKTRVQQQKIELKRNDKLVKNYSQLLCFSELILITNFLIKNLPGHSHLISLSLEHSQLLLFGILHGSSQEPIKRIIEYMKAKMKLSQISVSYKTISLQKIEFKILIPLQRTKK